VALGIEPFWLSVVVSESRLSALESSASGRRTLSSLRRGRTIDGMKRTKAGKVQYEPSAKSVKNYMTQISNVG
jgi:hypothetical protein